MAEKPNLDDAGGKSGRKSAKEAKVLKPSNLTELRKELSDYLDQMDQKKNDQEKMNGEFSMDFHNIKEKFANKTGHSQAHLTRVYTLHRRALKEELWRKEAEKADVDAIDELMAALEGIRGTPLYRAALDKAKGE